MYSMDINIRVHQPFKYCVKKLIAMYQHFMQISTFLTLLISPYTTEFIIHIMFEGVLKPQHRARNML